VKFFDTIGSPGGAAKHGARSTATTRPSSRRSRPRASDAPRCRRACPTSPGTPSPTRRHAPRRTPTACATCPWARRSTPSPTPPCALADGGPRVGRLPDGVGDARPACRHPRLHGIALACGPAERRPRPARSWAPRSSSPRCRSSSAIGAGDTVVIPTTAYPTYEVGALDRRAPTVLATDDPDEAAAASPALIWINSPANPHGAILSPDAAAGVGGRRALDRGGAGLRRVLRRVRLGGRARLRAGPGDQRRHAWRA
jgi:hypothetical protein